MWVFLVVFPILLGGQVSAEIYTTGEEHCLRVRKVLIQQLDDHRSNATVSECKEVKTPDGKLLLTPW